MRGFAFFAALGLAALTALAAYVLLRSQRSFGSATLAHESWDVPPLSRHDAFVDLVRFREQLVLAHVAAPYHMGTPSSTIRVRGSEDGRAWQELALLRLPGRDIRDPKLAVIGGTLFLYALANDDFLALPNETLVATSADGRSWSPFEGVGPDGVLFWRPKSRDGATWYVPGFAADGSGVRLFRSGDGRVWSEVSVLYDGRDASETEIEILPDGRMLALVRIETAGALVLGSDANATLLARSEPPYQSWTRTRIGGERLDGPLLLSTSGGVFAVARRQPGARMALTRLGGLLSRKRTALYRVEAGALVAVADLPSAGDTSYAGAVVRDGDVLVAYYTSDPERDYPWLLGMVMPTRIRIARIPLSELQRRAEATP